MKKYKNQQGNMPTYSLYIYGKRTSVRLSAPFKDTIDRIMKSENMTFNEIAEKVSDIYKGEPLSDSIRSHCVIYFMKRAKK